MKTSSDPREWYRQEELARHHSRSGRGRQPYLPPNLMPIYIVAACIAVAVVYLVLLAAGVDLSLNLRDFANSLARP